MEEGKIFIFVDKAYKKFLVNHLLTGQGMTSEYRDVRLFTGESNDGSLVELHNSAHQVGLAIHQLPRNRWSHGKINGCPLTSI